MGDLVEEQTINAMRKRRQRRVRRMGRVRGKVPTKGRNRPEGGKKRRKYRKLWRKQYRPT